MSEEFSFVLILPNPRPWSRLRPAFWLPNWLRL